VVKEALSNEQFSTFSAIEQRKLDAPTIAVHDSPSTIEPLASVEL